MFSTKVLKTSAYRMLSLFFEEKPRRRKAARNEGGCLMLTRMQNYPATSSNSFWSMSKLE